LETEECFFHRFGGLIRKIRFEFKIASPFNGRLSPLFYSQKLSIENEQMCIILMGINEYVIKH
jgi:hypothetical protein